MTYDDTFQRISELERGANTPFSIAERSEIESLYYAVLGRRIRTCNCTDKWHDAIAEMLHYLKKNGKMKEKSNYILRAGVVIQPSNGEVYTNDNLNDEIAAAFLEANPNARGLFEVIPDPSNRVNSNDDASRIAELEAENEALKAIISELESTQKDELSTDAERESSDALNAEIKSVIAAALASGESKTAIKSRLAGTEIDGIKLTVRLIAEYIKAIEGKTE